MTRLPRRGAFREGFSLIEVIIAAVVFFVMLMVFQTMFALATRGEGRDVRRSQALLMAAELMEQVTQVHRRFGDLPVVSGAVKPKSDGAVTLFGNPGGELHLSPDVEGFQRHLIIEELRVGKEDALVLPDRAYRILCRVTYSGPIGEPREEVLVNVRSRKVLHKPRLEKAPWL